MSRQVCIGDFVTLSAIDVIFLLLLDFAISSPLPCLKHLQFSGRRPQQLRGMCLCRFVAGFAALHCIVFAQAAQTHAAVYCEASSCPGGHAFVPNQLLQMIEISRVHCHCCGYTLCAWHFFACELRSLQKFVRFDRCVVLALPSYARDIRLRSTA